VRRCPRGRASGTNLRIVHIVLHTAEEGATNHNHCADVRTSFPRDWNALSTKPSELGPVEEGISKLLDCQRLWWGQYAQLRVEGIHGERFVAAGPRKLTSDVDIARRSGGEIPSCVPTSWASSVVSQHLDLRVSMTKRRNEDITVPRFSLVITGGKPHVPTRTSQRRDSRRRRSWAVRWVSRNVTILENY